MIPHVQEHTSFCSFCHVSLRMRRAQHLLQHRLLKLHCCLTKILASFPQERQALPILEAYQRSLKVAQRCSQLCLTKTDRTQVCPSWHRWKHYDCSLEQDRNSSLELNCRPRRWKSCLWIASSWRIWVVAKELFAIYFSVFWSRFVHEFDMIGTGEFSARNWLLRIVRELPS